MDQRVALGKQGEAWAREYLVHKGYRIVGQNVRLGHKEVDILATSEKKLILVEVKTRANDFFGKPEEQITQQKLRFLEQALHLYLREHAEYTEGQIDVIAIYAPVDGRKPTLKHFKAVEA